MYEQLGWESFSPRGKNYYLKLITKKSPLDIILRRKLKMSDEFMQSLFLCLGCGACEKVCHARIKPHEIWKKLKEWLFEQGYVKIDEQIVIHDRIRDYRNPYGEPNEKKCFCIPKDISQSKKPDIVFFQGCTASYKNKQIAVASARLLQSAKVPFTTLGTDEWCCGSFCIKSGQTDFINEFIAHNVKAINNTEARAVITACSVCYDTIKNEYPNYIGELPFEVYHISEYLGELINDGRLQLTKPLGKTVTFHDSCHLGRGAGVFDPPRKIINSIPGLELVEMERSREISRCCGAGSGCSVMFPDIANKIALDRIFEAKSTGAELIVTTCPMGNIHLNNANINDDLLRTVDLVQLAYQAV
jgi:Fe-S oxidoreductase